MVKLCVGLQIREIQDVCLDCGSFREIIIQYKYVGPRFSTHGFDLYEGRVVRDEKPGSRLSFN